ncbi:MAG: hypothetical protein IMF15_02100 [Proteobacteria bacterium]|nr:hypothetical protein [Pseudomonadota bacterium]
MINSAERRLNYAILSVLLLAVMVVKNTNADGIVPADFPDASLINDGRRIFFEETFKGNGRTCGTCHPEDNNFTIDVKFIASLPDDDPLFIAERPQPNPLSDNFEKPELMRKLGLILENTNGFDDLENGFTLRSVPHIFAMRVSLTPPSELADDGTSGDDVIMVPDERTGWSGDGSPSDGDTLHGTLRDFVNGAIKQHFTKTLNRQPGEDFRLPTEYEKDALEAFMLSLGRQQEFDDFENIKLKNAKAERGRLNYMGEGMANGVPCNACHFNGGANTDPSFDFPPGISPPAFESSNRSFAPRVEELLDQPGDVIYGETMPMDDGFGHGTNLFNVPSVIEAADTGPFFHANQMDTVEGMIAFYTSQRHMRNGEVLAPIVGLNGSQLVNVAAFLRILNADENIRSAIQLLDYANRSHKVKHKNINARLAKAQIKDAISVLDAANLHSDDVVPALKKTLRKINREHYRVAIATLERSRGMMIAR